MFEHLSHMFLIPAALAQSGSTTAASEVTNQTANQIQNLAGFIVSQIPLWITGGLVIGITFILAKVVQASVENRMAKSGFDEEHHEMQVIIARVSNVGVIMIGVTVGLKIAGIDLTSLLAAGAFGMGFALQDIIANFLSGVIILGSHNYSIGDNILINGVKGKIIEIQTRSTIIKKFDGTKMVVPNADLLKNTVISLTTNQFRRCQIPVGVEYGADLQKAIKACIKAAKESRNVVTSPGPSVWVTDFGESSINLLVNAWFESKNGIIKTKTDLMLNIKKEFDAVGLTIPWPIRTLYFAKDSEEAKEDMLNGITNEAPNKGDRQPVQQPVPGSIPAPVPQAQFDDTPSWLKKSIPQPTPKLDIPMGELILHPQVEQPVQPVQEPAPTYGPAPVYGPAPMYQPAPEPAPTYAPAPMYTPEPSYAQPPVEMQIAAPAQNMMPVEETQNQNFSAPQQ